MAASASHPHLTLVLGGQRSGKSAHAEALSEAMIETDEAHGAVYLATCRVGEEDADMADRIRRHVDRRGDRWVTVEEPFDLAGAVAAESQPGRPILIDSLGMWIANHLLDGRTPDGALDDLLGALDHTAGPVVVVAEEVGLGLVPENALGRAFIDALGEANQRVAGAADRVDQVVAGIARTIKP